MDTLIEILKKTTDFFSNKGIDHPRLNAELIFAHVLKCRRLDLYLQFERVMNEHVLDQMRPLVARRAKHEPLQYILGETSFCDLILTVNPEVLIPRPETEELVEKIGKYYQGKMNDSLRILDMGTGSGAIALSLAKLFQNSRVLAVDISPTALETAKTNAKRNGIENQVDFLRSNWFEKVEGIFDIIAANPPYLTEEEWSTATIEVKDHEPKAALVSENNGAADLIKILKEAQSHLGKNSLIAMETGIHHKEILENASQSLVFSKYEFVQDLSGRNRFFFAWK